MENTASRDIDGDGYPVVVPRKTQFNLKLITYIMNKCFKSPNGSKGKFATYLTKKSTVGSITSLDTIGWM